MEQTIRVPQAPASAAARKCGACTLCCKVFALEELNKPAGRWCVNARPGAGCVIHEARPGACRGFACLWLADTALPDIWKPDRARFVLSVELDGSLRVTTDPAQPSAWRRDPYEAQIRRWAASGVEAGKPVMLVVGAKVSVILPNTEIDVGVLQPGDAVELLHDGQRFHASVRRAPA
jgi:hypothetical protein